MIQQCLMLKLYIPGVYTWMGDRISHKNIFPEKCQ